MYGECGYGEFQDTCKPKLVKFPPDTTGNSSIEDKESYTEDKPGVLDMYLREHPSIT